MMHHLIRALIVLVFAAGASGFAWRWRRRRLSLAGAFALTLVITAGAAWVAAATPPWDDESTRLMIMHSLVEDGDLDLADDFRDESWRSFRLPTQAFFDDLAAGFRAALHTADGVALYSHYAPADLVPALPGFAAARRLAPSSAIAARLGARLSVWIAGALLVALFYRRLIEAEETPEDAMLLAAALLFAPMHSFLGVRLWPETYAALVLMLIVHHRVRAGGPLPSLALGALIGILPVLHLRYAFIALPAALALGLDRRTHADRLCLMIGILLAFSPFPGLWMIRHHEPTLALYRMVNFPDPTLTGAASAFSRAYLDLASAWGRFVAPPAGWVLYAPALLLFPLIRGWRGRGEALFCGAIAVGVTAQILFYCVASGPVGRYWSPLLPVMMLGLAGPRLARFRVPLMLLTGYGAIRSLLFAAFPVLAFDAKIAAQLAAEMPRAIGWLVYLLIG